MKHTRIGMDFVGDLFSSVGELTSMYRKLQPMIEIFILVANTADTLDLPHAIHITCANVINRKGALETVPLNLDTLSFAISSLTVITPVTILPMQSKIFMG